MMKTEGGIAERARYHAEVALIVTLCFIAAVSLWTPLAFERIADRWFHGGRLAYLWPVPFLTAAVAFIAWAGIRKGSGAQAFLSAMALFLLCFLGLAISTFPLSRAPERHHLAGRSRSAIPNLQPDRSALVFAARSRLYSLCLLDLPRQGRRERGLSLEPLHDGLLTCWLRPPDRLNFVSHRFT